MRCREIPGGDLFVSAMERDPLCEDRPDHLHHVLGRERHGEELVRHVAPRAVGHLVVLEVEAGVRERAEAAGVVVVHVGDDDLLDPGRLHPHQGQSFRRFADDLPLPAGRLLAGESGVDDDRALGVGDEPDVVVEVARGLVGVPADEVLGGGAFMASVADGVDGVGVHGVSRFWILRGGSMILGARWRAAPRRSQRRPAPGARLRLRRRPSWPSGRGYGLRRTSPPARLPIRGEGPEADSPRLRARRGPPSCRACPLR